MHNEISISYFLDNSIAMQLREYLINILLIKLHATETYSANFHGNFQSSTLKKRAYIIVIL